MRFAYGLWLVMGGVAICLGRPEELTKGRLRDKFNPAGICQTASVIKPHGTCRPHLSTGLSIGTCQWASVNRHLSNGMCQTAFVNGRLPSGTCQTAFANRHLSSGTCQRHLSNGIRQTAFVKRYLSNGICQRHLSIGICQ